MLNFEYIWLLMKICEIVLLCCLYEMLNNCVNYFRYVLVFAPVNAAGSVLTPLLIHKQSAVQCSPHIHLFYSNTYRSLGE